MVAKPNEFPVISGKNKTALNAIVKYIDREVFEGRGEESHHVYIAVEVSKQLAYRHADWLYKELVRLYHEEGGWKYCSVYATYHGGSDPGFKNYFYLSNSGPLVLNSTYDGLYTPYLVAGDAIRTTSYKKEDESGSFFAWLIALALVMSGLVYLTQQ